MGFEHKTFGSQLTIINGSVTSFIQLSLSSMFPELNLDYMSSEADYPEALALYQVFKLPLICANEPLEADVWLPDKCSSLLESLVVAVALKEAVRELGIPLVC